MQFQNLYLTDRELKIERRQLIDEGRDISSLEDEFDRLEGLSAEETAGRQEELNGFLDKTIRLPMREDYPYREPSDLESIRASRPEGARKFAATLDPRDLENRFLGAWLGRAAGCLLGKPVEGWKSARIRGYLEDLGRFPLDDYFRYHVPENIKINYQLLPERAFVDLVSHMVEDDDTNYTVAAQMVLKKHGPGFTPENIARFWLDNLPILHTWTAERVAYRNFTLNIAPPASAAYRNIYREWIGAQIRGDLFGWVALGKPELAAELAWRDGCVSHVKNGIYGEMWVAAMLASAPFVRDAREAVLAGLAEVPATCRLAGQVKEVVRWHDQGLSYETAVSRIHALWDENFSHHWCHVLSNAQIVALGLLWGENDFEKSVCRAVQAAFDTDCNGATVGSVIGLILGAADLPRKWTAPLNDRLETGLGNRRLVEITGLAREVMELYESVRGE